MPVPWRPPGQGVARTGGRVPARLGRLLVALLILTYAVIAGRLTTPSQAMDLPPPPPGSAARSPSAQVRIFENGTFVGGGTLVHRSWVLTARHLLLEPNNPDAYLVRFGVVNDRNDPNDTAHLRSIDRIVPAPLGDMAMVHLADPVPEGTWFPDLAIEMPYANDQARVYGWGDGGHTLNRTTTIVADPDAAATAAYRRPRSAVFAAEFPNGINPMVVNVIPERGDSGSAVFVNAETLTAVRIGMAPYLSQDHLGHFVDPHFTSSVDLPVWMYRQWILDTMNGAGSSSGDPGQGQPPGRRLTDTANGNLPMTMPPQTAFCDEDTPCNAPAPAWAQGTLQGAGNYRGTAQARCATAQNNTCSFNGTPYPPGTSARMTLGPASAPTAPGTRQVMVWCKTTTPFPNPDSPTRQVLRVSFTNADPDLSPIGYGWWDLTPDQVTTANNQTPLNTSQLNPC